MSTLTIRQARYLFPQHCCCAQLFSLRKITFFIFAMNDDVEKEHWRSLEAGVRIWMAEQLNESEPDDLRTFIRDGNALCR